MAALLRLPPRLPLPTERLRMIFPLHATPRILSALWRPLMTKRDFYIDGRWTAPASARDAQVSHASPFRGVSGLIPARDLQVINPSTEAACAVISLGSDADTDAAVAAAKAALPAWSASAPAVRRAYVNAILAQYSSRSHHQTPPTKPLTPYTPHPQSRGNGASHQHRNGLPHRPRARRTGCVLAVAHQEFFESIRQY